MKKVWGELIIIRSSYIKWIDLFASCVEQLKLNSANQTISLAH